MRSYLKQPLVIATLIACICGLLDLVAPLDQIYWNVRFGYGQVEAPQSIVLVNTDVDEQSGAPDWSDGDEARLLGVVSRQLPQHVYVDRPIKESTPELSDQLERMAGRVSLIVRFAWPDLSETPQIDIPEPASIGGAPVVLSGWQPNFWGYAMFTRYRFGVGNKTYPTLGAALAGKADYTGSDNYRPDFAIDPATIRTVAARDIMANRMPANLLTGKTVIIGPMKVSRASSLGYLGHGRVNPLLVDIAGMAGAARGYDAFFSGLPFVLLFAAGAYLVGRIPRRVERRVAYVALALIMLALPALLERLGLFNMPSPGFVALLIFVGAKIWAHWRLHVLQTSISGLPNFEALAASPAVGGQDIIVAVIARYDEFLATLPRNLHGECAKQIARRISVGSGASEIFHYHGGYFAWLEPSRLAEPQTEHLEGMRALFSAPLLVGGHMFDTNIHFGLDSNPDADMTTRINSALVSASEALKNGRTIEHFEASRLANAPWELSLLARIDEGMRNGDIWLAYQPQWDYHLNRISGAEALIRWNDPVRGPIRPDAFILQAERAGRIDALTYWVLDQAITAAEEFNALAGPFQMSINLSAQLVDKPSLVSAMAEIVRRRGTDCRLLTVEVTETASVYNRPAAIQNLQQLRAMGFRLSIDDFGTGEASLCYLAELPSDELKLDLRFVSRIVKHERERHIVASTIQLAHALNQSVVAEGIEDLPTFNLLRDMGCDVGQGYYIGRPETFEHLKARCSTSNGAVNTR